MATFGQRAVSIFDAMVNGIATPAQQAAILAAWCPNLPADYTQAQKAQVFVQTIVRHTRRAYQNQLPTIDAAIAAAAAQAEADIPDA